MPTDPFEALGSPTEPMTPRASFTIALRRRLESALGVPPSVARAATLETDRSTTVSDTTTLTQQAVVPYLSVHDGAAALDWYRDVLGAFETLRYEDPDGKLGHAEFVIGDARFMLSDEWPEGRIHSPQSIGGTTVSIYLVVREVDYIHQRAVDAGATSLRPPENQSHGNRTATVIDPFGHRWMFAQPVEELTIDQLNQGEPGYTVTGTPQLIEMGYFTLHVAEVAPAAEFFGALFGWEVTPSGHVSNTRQPFGLNPDPTTSRNDLFFRVDDVDRYADRVIELGGEVLSKTEYDSGGNAHCRFAETEFQLWKPAPGY